MAYLYRYVGDDEQTEIFPLLPVVDGPVTRAMHRGDEVECSEPVAHARLELVSGPAEDVAAPDPVSEDAAPDATPEDVLPEAV